VTIFNKIQNLQNLNKIITHNKFQLRIKIKLQIFKNKKVSPKRNPQFNLKRKIQIMLINYYNKLYKNKSLILLNNYMKSSNNSNHNKTIKNNYHNNKM
jgi:hypothetical protein